MWIRGLESPEKEELCPIRTNTLDPTCTVELKLKLSTINEAPVGDDEDPSPDRNIQLERIRWSSDRGTTRPSFDAQRQDGFKTPNSDSGRDTPMLAPQANATNLDTFQF